MRNQPKPGKGDLLQSQTRCPEKENLRNEEGNPECKEIFANQDIHKQFISQINKQLTILQYLNNSYSVKILNHYVVAQHKYTYVNQLYFNLKKKTGGIVTNTKEKKKKGTK